MTVESVGSDEGSDREVDRQADAMKASLRKDVASWTAARNDTAGRQAAELSVPATKPTPARQTTPTRKVSPAPAQPNKPSSTVKRPFSMSYDGVTTAEHIEYMIARGAK